LPAVKPDPIWILVWMVAALLLVQVYVAVKTVGLPKRRKAARPPLSRRPFDPYFVRDDLAPASEADFEETELESVL
jgi:hypothetical protein